MTDATPLLALGLVLLVAALLGAVARRLGLPAIVAYLLVGLAVGPFTPGYFLERQQLEPLADVGVILLLFEVGIELDVRALRRDEPRGLLIAAPVQVALGVAFGAALALATGMSLPGALTIGLATALSSSVVVVNMSRSRRRTLDDRTGRTLVVWAVLQDVMSLVAVALLAAMLDPSGGGVAVALLRLVAFAALASLAHVFIVPRLLAAVRSEGDTFLIASVSVALVTAAVGAVVFGVPVALAAFVAGLALSADPKAQEARREVIPFRDLFAVLFFVAIGTLVDPAAIADNWLWFSLALGLVALKSLVATALAAVARLRVRKLQLGVGLGQIGEFSFVVLGLGVAAGAISSGVFSAVLAAAVVSITLSAIAVRLFPQEAASASGSLDSARGSLDSARGSLDSARGSLD